MEKTKFWEEAPGEQSMTRLAFALLILMAVYIAIYQVMTTGTFEIVQFTTIITTACGLKLWSRKMENTNIK